MREIAVFEPQQIGGRWVKPLCLPVDSDIVPASIAASLNLVWFALNIVAEKGDKNEVGRLALMCKAIIAVEHPGMSIASDEDLQEAIDRIEEVEDTQSDDYEKDDNDDRN